LHGSRYAKTDQWKLIENSPSKFKSHGWELYNLKTDFNEQHNVYAEHPEIVKVLNDKYLRYAMKMVLWILSNTIKSRENQMKQIMMLSSFLLICACQKTTPQLEQTTLPNLGSKAKCNSYSGLPSGWPKNKEAGMVKLPQGIVLGTTQGYEDERPLNLQPTSVPAFLIDATEVTNAQFQEFVKQTGYVTDAEKQGGAAMFIQQIIQLKNYNGGNSKKGPAGNIHGA
jgi:formylglycine-generating enzyme required for sulfatase activity